MNLLVRISLVFVLAFSAILGPLPSFLEGNRAYANPGLLAGKPAAAALAAVLGASGYALGNLDADGVEQLYDSFSTWALSDEAQVAVKASQDAFLTNPAAKVVSGSIAFTATRGQSLLDQLDSWGNAGFVALDALNTYTGDAFDVLSDIPFAFDAFIRYLSSSSGSSGVVTGSLVNRGFEFNVSSSPFPGVMKNDVLHSVFLYYDGSHYYFADSLPSVKYVGAGSDYVSIRFTSSFSTAECDAAGVYVGGGSSLSATVLPVSSNPSFVISETFAQILDSSFSLPDNPDVINPGLDSWDDSTDVIGGIADGSALYGSDAVIDGDYIVNRGNMSIPWDWTDINSWADLLRQLGLGVAEGVYGDAIGLGDTAISVDGAGEIVTDTVGELSANPGSTSPSRIRNWKNLGLKFKQIFPFCLYFDLVEMIVILDHEPVAPKFDWVVPSIWEGSDYKITVDMSVWDSAASFLRMLLTFAFAVGFVFLLLRFVNPGRDNSDDGGSKG